ncbi:MAG TPA: colanic acid biosynthesis glycosyltransferase WcaL, partial [Aliiroseovarius sp.]|nr:colanic acid biosynthesis glycosyltransferase WcaL [Aliiroseovarius sp.]
RLDEKTARARFVACISYFARSQCMLFSDPEHWDKLRIIHCGIVPELYEAGAPGQEPGQSDGPHFVFVGRLAAVKGLRVLLKAFEQARKTEPGLRLTLVGDGPDRAFLEEAARPLGDAVHFAGYQSQSAVAGILATADALVLPSFAEGVPVVLMEAMASGKPVIATRVAGVPELVENGVSGFLVAPGNPDELAEKLILLGADPALRARMGDAGRRKVREEFDVRTEAARLRSLFELRGGGAVRPDP